MDVNPFFANKITSFDKNFCRPREAIHPFCPRGIE